MSRSAAQLRTFETVWAELCPHITTDRNLPVRIQQRLAKEKRFGSRDRRLYRELIYTALRYLPWLEASLTTPVFSFQFSVFSSQTHSDTRAHTPERQLLTENCKLKTENFSGGSAAALWLSPDTPATLPLKRDLLATAPPCPATITERATLLGQSPDALLPAWFRAHCPAAFSEPNLTTLHTRAPLWLRLQTDDPAPVLAEFTARGWTWRETPALSNALELIAPNDPDLSQTDAYQRGLIEIQDLGSQLILPTALANLPLQTQPRWLDACAGAGGKTLQLACILGSAAQIDATDPRPSALAELTARAARASLKNIRILTSGNPKSPIQNPKSYDGILVDAPCSGTGTWRRNPHLKYSTPESAIHDAAKLQHEILARHAPLVRAGGGLLIYATCSLSRVENENVVAAFLADPAHRDFTLIRQTAILPAEHNTDGFFTATLRRGVARN